MPLNRTLSALALFGLSYLTAGCSESGSSPGATQDSGTGGTAGASTGGSGNGGGFTDAGSDAGGNGGACAAMPEGVPPCWERLVYPPETGGCDVFFPGERGEMPPPLTWTEPVELPTTPPISARQIVRDLGDGNGLFDLSAFPEGLYDPETNRVLLTFNRGWQEIEPRYRLVADAEGPILNAYQSIHTGNTACEFISKPLSSSTHSLSAASISRTYGGAIIAPIGTRRPSQVIHMPGESGSTFRASSDLVVRWGPQVFVRSTGSDTETSIAFSGGLGDIDVRGKSVFLTFNNDPVGTDLWTEERGLVPFIRLDASSSRGASNSVTDGRDWVWTEGTRGMNGKFDNLEMFTAPYTEDPAQLRASARRVRKEPTPSSMWALSTGYPRVGCGHHAQIYVTAAGYQLRVTRLSDGHAWIVDGPDLTDPTVTPWLLARVLAVSCEEVFVQIVPSEIARIRLDELGPGVPAD